MQQYFKEINLNIQRTNLFHAHVDHKQVSIDLIRKVEMGYFSRYFNLCWDRKPDGIEKAI